MQYKPRSNTTPVKSPPTTTNSSPVKHETTPHTHVSAHSATSAGTPSILQVPSLASPNDMNGSPTSPPSTKRMGVPRGSPQSVGTYVSTAGRPNMPFWFVDANHQAVLVQYRPSCDESMSRSPPHYSPVRVRSTRGRPSSGPLRRSPIVTPVRRMEESSGCSTSSVGSTSKRRFPISQRGRSRAVSRPITGAYVSSTSSAVSAGSQVAPTSVVDKSQEI